MKTSTEKNSQNKRLVIGISSRALFNLDDSHQIFEKKGLDAYRKYQIENENIKLQPGPAFNLIRKLLKINTFVKSKDRLVDIVLLSRNSADTGLRVFNSIEEYQLDITRAAFCGGNSPFPYIQPFQCNLFLSAHKDDVVEVLDNNHAAATIFPRRYESKDTDDLVRIAFDGDAVLFSDASERVFQEQGLKSFTDNEKKNVNKPLSGGPFKNFLSALHHLQSKSDNVLRTALVTSRGAPAHKRVILTLREWNIKLDESFFLSGSDKGDFLKSFKADVFFDDQKTHCKSTNTHVTTGHVPHGIANS